MKMEMLKYRFYLQLPDVVQCAQMEEVAGVEIVNTVLVIVTEVINNINVVPMLIVK
jgi:hypothetical protein